MVKARIELPKIAEFLDTQRTALVREFYDPTGYPGGFELREIVEKDGGKWVKSSVFDTYDRLRIPYDVVE